MGEMVLSTMFNLIDGNEVFISVLIFIIWGYWQYKRYIDEWNFKNYHQLIRDLNQSDTPGEPIKLYRQVAIVYELRNYPRYFSVTKKILSGWIKNQSEGMKGFSVLYDEMRETINYIDSSKYARFIMRLKNK